VAADGSGLGLSIVARIVELHGGALRADSERGEGTHVEICLPASGTGTATKTRTAEPSASDGW
jgi:signal transduction histidine kinase